MRLRATFGACALAALLAAPAAAAEPSLPPEILEQLDQILNEPGDTAARFRAMRILADHQAGRPVPAAHVAAAIEFTTLETKINCPNGSKDPNDLRRKHELALYLMKVRPMRSSP